MSAEIIPFAFNDKLVRTVSCDGEPWLVGRDVCAVLEIKNESQALARLDADERSGYVIQTPFGPQEAIVISEPGVYRLVFTSRKPEAEAFKRWLAHEVLPQLRKTGRYATVDQSAPEPDLMGEPLPALSLKLAMVREARQIFGPARARALWASLDLPRVAPQESEAAEYTADADALACLRHLCSHALTDDQDGVEQKLTMGELIFAAANGDEDSRWNLMKWGVRIEDATARGEERVWVAHHADGLKLLFCNSRWNGAWREALSRLPGARRSGPYRVEKQLSRGTSFPLENLDLIQAT